MLMGTGNALLTASARTVGPKLGPGSTCLKTDMGSVRVVAFIPQETSLLSILYVVYSSLNVLLWMH